MRGRRRRTAALVIDDIVPGHTGKGADFRLAEMKVGDYPGIYHMVEIPRAGLAPAARRCRAGKDSVNLDYEAEDQLEKAGYIIGRLQRVIFHDPGIKDTNWSATAPVHRPGRGGAALGLPALLQGGPALDQLAGPDRSPACGWSSATRCTPSATWAAARCGSTPTASSGWRRAPRATPAWSEGHPLSEAANQLIASMVRKVGGFTFQELNLAIDDIRDGSERGADLSYDFVNRPAYHHALATGDTEFLRLTLNAARRARASSRCRWCTPCRTTTS